MPPYSIRKLDDDRWAVGHLSLIHGRSPLSVHDTEEAARQELARLNGAPE